VAYVLAGALAIALAHSVYQIPIQVSDSLEVIVASDEAPSVGSLFLKTGPGGTLRPLRYVQSRWLTHAARATGLPFHVWFRGLHAAITVTLVFLFAVAVPVATWLDLAAFGFALTVFTGIHTFPAMLQESFPVNHFAEVTVVALLAVVLAQRRPHVVSEAALLVLLGASLLLVESGVLIWVILVTCAALRLPGIRPRTAVAATLVLVAYLGARQYFEVGAPSIGAHGSGYGASFYSGDELSARFGNHPLPFLAYNVAGAALSVLFSEPRYGVYSLFTFARPDGPSPVVPINIGSSLLVTGLIAWFAAGLWRRGWRAWDRDDRLVVLSGVVLMASAFCCLTYIKDEILTAAGAFYAISACLAARGLLQSLAGVNVPRRLALVVPVFFLVAAPLWTFRTLGTHFQLRHAAFITRNDWVRTIPVNERESATSETARLTRRLRAEAIGRPVTSEIFLPRWGDRYWTE
jgi:hypothetical protein